MPAPALREAIIESAGVPEPDFRAMFEAAPVALLVFDSDLTMVHANPRYLEAVGMPLDAIAGRHVFDVFGDDPDADGPSQAQALEAVMRAAVDRGETQVLSEYRYDIPAAGGGFEQRVWNVTEVPVLDARGEVEVVLHYTEDVTSLVRVRDAREEAYRLIESLNERLSRSSERDRSIAETLQRALQTQLPSPPGISLTGSYRAAAGPVGGDWYDAVTMPDGSTSVMVGDVAGHDLEAAAEMGQLRNMLRTLAWAGPTSPAGVMTLLDQAITDLLLDTTASAVLASVQPPRDGDRVLMTTWASAGHPPPVLVSPDGVAEVLDVPGDPLLGLGSGPGRVDSTTELEPGAALLLYTDGLVERRRESIDVGIDRLAGTAQRFHRDSDRIERILDAMLDVASGEGAQEDDVALVVIENPADPRP